jgi:FkbM family methyltransferase
MQCLNIIAFHQIGPGFAMNVLHRLLGMMDRRALGAAGSAFRRELRLQSLVCARTPFGFRLIGDASMQQGNHETEEVACIRRFLPDAAVFVDVGAYVGFYTCLARSMGKHVIAVEPLRENLMLLLKNLDLNGWRDVEVWPVGLGAAPGIARMYGVSTGASLIRGWAKIVPSLQEDIAVTTLDRLLALRFENEKLVIKIDAEGAEFDILEGAAETLARRPRPVWLVEVCLEEHHPSGRNPHFTRIFERFWEEGYCAFTAEEQNRPIAREDVDRWYRKNRRDFGGPNVLFVDGTDAFAARASGTTDVMS